MKVNRKLSWTYELLNLGQKLQKKEGRELKRRFFLCLRFNLTLILRNIIENDKITQSLICLQNIKNNLSKKRVRARPFKRTLGLRAYRFLKLLILNDII